MSLPRRALVLVALVAGTAAADPAPAPTFLPPRGAPGPAPAPRKKDPAAQAAVPTLRDTLCTVYNLHTGEALALGATPAPDEDALLARLLRDRTTWEEHPIDAACVASLRRAAAALHARRVEVVSAYRSDKLNELLRKKGRHVARHSQHVLGRAIDFRLAGVEARRLLSLASRTHRGGIGFYPHSGFVHLDAGPRRRWRGE